MFRRFRVEGSHQQLMLILAGNAVIPRHVSTHHTDWIICMWNLTPPLHQQLSVISHHSYPIAQKTFFRYVRKDKSILQRLGTSLVNPIVSCQMDKFWPQVATTAVFLFCHTAMYYILFFSAFFFFLLFCPIFSSYCLPRGIMLFTYSDELCTFISYRN